MKIKKMLLVVLALYWAFVISCAGDPEPAPPPPPPPVQETVSAVVAPPPAQETVSAIIAAPTTPPPPSTDIVLDGAEFYTVVRGDTLSIISKRFYGNGYYYALIVLGSGNLISDIDLIEPGMRLTIPNLQRNLNSAGAKTRLKNYLSDVAVINSNRNRPEDAEEIRRIANSL